MECFIIAHSLWRTYFFIAKKYLTIQSFRCFWDVLVLQIKYLSTWRNTFKLFAQPGVAGHNTVLIDSPGIRAKNKAATKIINNGIIKIILTLSNLIITFTCELFSWTDRFFLFYRTFCADKNCPWRQCLGDSYLCCSLSFDWWWWFQRCHISQFFNGIHTKIQVHLSSCASVIQCLLFVYSLNMKHQISQTCSKEKNSNKEILLKKKKKISQTCILCFSFLVGWVFCVLLMGKLSFCWVWLIDFFNCLQTRLKWLKIRAFVWLMSCDCSLHRDYSQELLHFNWKQLEKCSTDIQQLYQPKPAAVEMVI